MASRKGDIGFLVPAGNRVILPEMYRMAGERFGFFETRLMVSGDQISRKSNFAMIENIKRGMQELQTARVDVCVFACTVSSFLKGREWDHDFCEQWGNVSDFPVTTTVLSLIESLRHLKARKIAVATPWHEVANTAAKNYMENCGFDVVSMSNHPLNRFEVNDMDPQDTFRFAGRADSPEADCLCIFATDLPSADILQKLEEELGKPVISSNSAILWNSLRLLDIRNSVKGFGRLLSA
jgi:arylmalonate decarboxylase